MRIIVAAIMRRFCVIVLLLVMDVLFLAAATAPYDIAPMQSAWTQEAWPRPQSVKSGWMRGCTGIDGCLKLRSHPNMFQTTVTQVSASRARLHLRGGGDAMVDDEERFRAAEQGVGHAKRLSESLFQKEEEDWSPQERAALQSSKIVVPSDRCTTVLAALSHARAPEERRDGQALRMDDEDMEGESIFIRKGIHNISSDPEVTLVKAVAITAQAGAVLAAYAAPRQEDIAPDFGGGRMRIEEEASGSVLRGLEWWSDNVQCVIVEGAAVLFSECTFKCRAGAYVSALWAMQGAHISMVNCTAGGFDKQNQASNAVVVSGSQSMAALQKCVLHYCQGATIALENNGSASASHTYLCDSFSAISVSDGRLHDGEARIPGSLTLHNCTVKCVNGMWRDEDRPINLALSEVIELEQDFPEFAHLVNKPYPYPELEWDSEREEWEYAGASQATMQRHQEYYNKYKRPEEADLAEVNRQVRAQRQAAEWESSEQAEETQQIVSIEPKRTDDAKDVVAFDVRRREHSSVLRDLRPRYKNAHGHEGLPPRPRNRHFAGVQKHPRVKRAGRHTYKRS